MNLPQKERSDLLEQVKDEGNPSLLVGPCSELPSNLPTGWAELLGSANVQEAMISFWSPLKEYLPKTLHAMQERLLGVALLSTQRVKASLLYFFKEGDYTFIIRGRAPRRIQREEAALLPSSFLDFYRLHDGWTMFYAGDDGPLPSAEWMYLTEWTDPVNLDAAPGDIDPKRFLIVFRSGSELAIGYDLSQPSPICLKIWDNGEVELIPDIWHVLDYKTSVFLQQLDPIIRRT